MDIWEDIGQRFRHAATYGIASTNSHPRVEVLFEGACSKAGDDLT